ncbi:site-specific DNA-methyltransferase [Clostridium sp.]|uniref:DNA-methyltransferase n=1 Tax=Clostridium sp. TaxID=1506 RepID=UPI00262294B4|nr:site-specific DNA-methyltransferase [Clostridium sp.]
MTNYSLYNEDCMKVLPNIEDKSIQCIITDLPFDIVTDYGKERAKYSGQLRKLDKGKADVLTFDLNEFLNQVARVSDGCIYLFCGYQQLSQIFNYFHDNKDFMVRVCYWHKTNPSPMNGQHMYLNAVEPIVFAKRRKKLFNAKCVHNWFQFNQDEEYIDFIKNHKEVYTLPTGRSKIHPTEKSIPLLQQMILDSTEEFDTVADFCGGSLSTGMAALELDRNFIGVELDKTYFDLGKERLENTYNN